MNDLDEFSNFTGVIEEVNEDSLLLKTNESFGDLAHISLDDKIKMNYKIGDEIIVYYDGTIKESFPVQINPHAIIIMNKNKIIDKNKNEGNQANLVDLKTSINNFAYKSSPELLSENSNYSPISAYLAMALASIGANGDTKKELSNVLNLSTDLTVEVNELMKKLNINKNNSKLLLANSLWVEKEIDGKELIFNETFLKNAENNFNVDLFTADFGNPRTGKEMTKWISENTQNLLKPEVVTAKGEIASIINTIYFKDNWSSQFETANTKIDKFTKANKEEIEVDFMKQTLYSKYYQSSDWTKASLPFEGGGEMFFVLPNKDIKLNALINEKSLKTIVESNSENLVNGNWSVPKFTIDSKFELVPMFEKLGVKEAFDTRANFENMVENANVYISNITQGSKIIVEEGGVEAAAYTQAMFKTTSFIEEEVPKNFILSNPFLYGIIAPDGTILFIGTYYGKQ